MDTLTCGKEMNRPLVSVIVVTMNDEHYIAATIESVLAQDYPCKELHIQHGSRSSDDTLSIIRRYPVSYRSEADTSQADAANKGIAATKGELLVLLGGDDILSPGALTTLTRALECSPQAAFAYGDVDYIDQDGQPFYQLRGKAFDLDDLFWKNHVPSQSVMMRRSALSAVGGYREMICADWDLWIRLGSKYPSCYLPIVLAGYRVHEGSTSLNNLIAMAEAIAYSSSDLLQRREISDQLIYGPQRAAAGANLTASILALLAGSRLRALRFLLTAIRRYPLVCTSLRGLYAIGAILCGRKMYLWVKQKVQHGELKPVETNG